ncbi:hypothetical protein QCA50_006273 [Cerrena zonata]|uniref:Uncharacterized protein n=1 Tax=Cerrena zonata TaxID=2478898 RepID=A0AAW0GCX9_9APHY
MSRTATSPDTECPTFRSDYETACNTTTCSVDYVASSAIFDQSQPPPYVPSPPASQPHSPITPHTPTNPFAVPAALQASFKGSMSQQPTPTQAHFAQAPQPQQTPPFHPAQSYGYPQSQPQVTGGHIPEATEASYYTAQQGHSRPVTMTEDAYAGYDASPSLR